MVFPSENELFDSEQPKQIEFYPMKSMFDRIRRLIAAYSQKPASSSETITPPDPHQTDLVPSSEPRRLSERVKVNVDAKRKKLGVEDGLKDIPGVTTRMLAAFGKHGIKSIEDLAGCATDDLHGWSESKDGQTIRHKGILDGFRVSRKDCEAMIISARVKAGWIK
jgi:N utilization substance protein A